MAAADMADGECHCHYGKAKCQRYPQQADTDIRKRCCEHSTATTAKHQPEGA